MDGRIEAQGTIEELRSEGHLAAIVATEEAEIKEEATFTPEEEVAPTEVVDAKPAAQATEPKKDARKMVKDEEREVGNVQVSFVRLDSGWGP